MKPFRLSILLSAISAVGVFAADHGQPAPAVAAPLAREKFHIYLLMGQSNMVGRDTRGLDSQTDDPRILTLDTNGQWIVARDPIHPQVGSIAGGVGPGIPFALEMLKADTNIIIGLVPCAVGGTPLRRWTKSKDGDLYRNAVSRAKVAEQTGVISGVLWHQGETDSKKKKDAEFYEARLTKMFADLRADLGAAELPIVVGQLGDFLALTPEKNPYSETVRAAIKNIPTVVPHAGFADSAGLEHKGDKLHFSAEAQKEFGARYAKAMLELQKPKAAASGRIARFSGDCAAAISYTFDDGLRDQFTLGVPMLNEFGFKGTFFVIPGKIAGSTTEAEQRKNDKRAWGTITWDELQSMDAQGHEIASHTWSHRSLVKVPPDELESELTKPYDAIKEHIGKPPLTLAFPFNQSTPEIQAAALKTYVACRTYQIGTSAKTTTALLNAWADRLVQEKKWGVLMAHAITNGYAAMTDPEVLREHLKYVKNRGQDIWVDTFANIARYEKERDEARLTLTGKTGSVTCVLSNSLDPQRYNVPLTIVIDATDVTTVSAERSGRQLPVHITANSICIQASPSPQPILIRWK